MSDVVDAPQVEPTSAANDNGSAPDVAELTKQLEEMKNRFNGMQRILSERDKEKAELARQAEEDKRSKMSELDKLKADFDRQQQETAKWMREATIKENTMKAKDELSKMGLPMSTLDVMDVSSEESLKASIERVSKIAEEIKQSASQEFAAKYGQTPPKTGGGAISNDEKQQIAILRQQGNIEAANRLAIKSALNKQP